MSTVLFFSYALGAVGCKTGDYIYTVQNGTYFDGGSFIARYTATDRITKRNYAADPNCGIDRSTADTYPVVAGTLANPQSKCASQININDQGVLVNYNPSDSTCMALPLDDSIPYLLAAIGVFGFILIRKNDSLMLL